MRFTILLIALFSFLDLSAQGSAFGIKGGPTLGFQQWNGRDSELLVRYHGVAYIETYREDAPFALFGQAGYHIRGGATRIRGGAYTNPDGNFFNFPTTSYPYEFRNVSLAFGAKQKFPFGQEMQAYYMVGVRGEYTINTNLDEYHPENDPFRVVNLIHPFDELTRHWQYGIIAGGGIEFMFADLVGGMIELSISPDLSQQYFQAETPYNDPFTGNPRTLSAREIRNVSIELSIGLRFLRIVEYVD